MWNPFKRKPEALPKVKDTWDLAQTVSNGRPMFLRVNTGLRAVMGKPPSAHRVGVTFVLRAPNEHGLPDTAESETLNQFEDALLPALGVPGPAYLAVVITTNGFREFVFYTSTPESVAAKLDALRAQFAANEIQSYVERDADWDVYRSFVG